MECSSCRSAKTNKKRGVSRASLLMVMVPLVCFSIFIIPVQQRAILNLNSGTAASALVQLLDRPPNLNAAPPAAAQCQPCLAASPNNPTFIPSPPRSSTTHPPVDCRDVFSMNRRNAQNNKNAVHDTNNGGLYARYTTTEPAPFWVSLHNAAFDATRWPMMDSGNYYERQQTAAFIEILTTTATAQTALVVPEPLHVIDVGANIGWFSLLSMATALSGSKSTTTTTTTIVVDAFEPNPRNRLRMCEAIRLNDWIDHPRGAIHLYPLGVSSTKGRARMSISTSGLGQLGVYDPLNATETVEFPIVSLDDMAQELGWTGAHILKVDVEGFELEVFRGAEGLLKAGRVDHIFFEGNFRTDEETKKLESIVELLVSSNHYAHMHGGWMGPNHLVKTKIASPANNEKYGDDEVKAYVQALTAECKSGNEQVSQCNMWWRRRGG